MTTLTPEEQAQLDYQLETEQEAIAREAAEDAERVRNLPPPTVRPSEIICNRCGGSGDVPGAKDDPVRRTCPVCRGQGVKMPPPPRPRTQVETAPGVSNLITPTTPGTGAVSSSSPGDADLIFTVPVGVIVHVVHKEHVPVGEVRVLNMETGKLKKVKV